MSLVLKSTPMVAVILELKSSPAKLEMRLDLPTPESPSNTTTARKGIGRTREKKEIAIGEVHFT